MSDSSASPPTTGPHSPSAPPAESNSVAIAVVKAASPTKRKASAAGIDSQGAGRAVKRRASKACQCCRARKVRCNVTEHGAPCTNCRLDEVECIVSESRRKKKSNVQATVNPASAASSGANRKLVSRDALDCFLPTEAANSGQPHHRSHETEPRRDEHVPHTIYQSHHSQQQSGGFAITDIDPALSAGSQYTPPLSVLGYTFPGTDSQPSLFAPGATRFSPASQIPSFIKPLPERIGEDEIAYLERKGALTVPAPALRNELLCAYVEYVHPYMPLLDLRDFVLAVEQKEGHYEKVSLILFQAVMFAGSAFVGMASLRLAGYASRKEARKDFFQKTRLLYDFDYDSDRVSLVQSLLLLTYYYETPDDQKDTWHWMGVATSVAHTIGLHRNPEKSSMEPKRKKLWKRIWWSTYMRDRLIALGMRRPTRIKTGDYDVPMLTLDDFETEPLPDSVTSVPADCAVARDPALMHRLAVLCIEKAKLCLCISHVLSKQYCVLNNNQGMHNDRTSMMLLPKKLDPETCEVRACDEELQKWLDNLPEEARLPGGAVTTVAATAADGERADEAAVTAATGESGGSADALAALPAPLDLHLSLLHMVYFTTLSALHRPQVLPASPSAAPPTSAALDLLEVSRTKVRLAASEITAAAARLDARGLVRFLPTTGVTVLLPAIIIHLLDIKSPDEAVRRRSLHGFGACMAAMAKLRDIYAAADYSTVFLEAAVRKAGIAPAIPAPPPPPPSASPLDNLVLADRRLDSQNHNHNHNHHPFRTRPRALPHVGKHHPNLTPPPDLTATATVTTARLPFGLAPAPHSDTDSDSFSTASDAEVARRLHTYLASTPPDSSSSLSSSTSAAVSDGPQRPPAAFAPGDAQPYESDLLLAAGADDLLHHHHQQYCDGADDGGFAAPDDFADFDALLDMDAVAEGFAESSFGAVGAGGEAADGALEGKGLFEAGGFGGAGDFGEGGFWGGLVA